MARQHPVHDAVAALTRVQRERIQITPTVAYRVEAPCLLQQLAEELGVSSSTTGGGGVARSKLLLATDAWDLWVEINHNTHAWARELDIDRSPYLPRRRGGTAPDRPDQQRQPAPWYATMQVADDTPAEILTQIGARLGTLTAVHVPPATARQLVADPGRRHELPPVGRLLRLVAGTATSRGLDPVADAIHRSAVRWRAHIEEMLHGVQEQRGVRGAACPDCGHLSIYEDRDDGRYVVPAIVLVTREVAGEQLQWIACQACGWSKGAGDLIHASITAWLATLADCWRRLFQLLPPRERTPA